MRFLILNASLGGNSGNSSALLELLAGELKSLGVESVTVLNLKDCRVQEAVDQLSLADGLVIGTGTYWDSWSSHLQAFLEQVSSSEGTSLWLGKPVGVVVTMHSVGGKGVLSRLQGVLNTLGCLIPPMCGIVYSWVNQEVLGQEGKGLILDLWRPEDVKVMAHNLVIALEDKDKKWKTWEVDRGDFSAKWMKEKGSEQRNIPVSKLAGIASALEKEEG